MAVLMNEAMAREPDLAETVIRETGVMRRQINHHLARARAIGRRAAGHARAEVWPSLEAVALPVSRMHSHPTVDITGDRHSAAAGDRQALEESTEERRGGNGVVITCSSRCVSYHLNKNQQN